MEQYFNIRITSNMATGMCRALGMGVGIYMLTTQACFSQSLNEAVKSQLEVYNNEVCGRLLEGEDPSSVLTGALAGANLCGRQLPAGGSTNTSTSAGTATPTTILDIANNLVSSSTTTEEYSKGNFFITIEKGSLDRDVTQLEDGYDSKIQTSIIGGDYRFNDKLVAGMVIELSQNYIDYDAGGNSNIETNGIIAYISYSLNEDLLVQLYGGTYSQNYERTRLSSFVEFDSFGGVNTDTSGTPDADFDANQYSAGAQLSYNFVVGQVSFAPNLAIDWLDTNYDTYNEAGESGLELKYHDDEISSLQSSAAIDISVAIRSGGWVLIPQLGINFKHEFDNDQREIEISFVDDTRSKRFSFETDEPDRNWLQYNIGLVVVAGKHTQVFANYRTIASHDYYEGKTLSIGMRSSI